MTAPSPAPLSASDVPAARRHRVRADGRLVRAGDEARRPRQAGHRLQQVAVDDRARQAPRRDRPRRPSRRCSRSPARTSCSSPCRSRPPRRRSRRSATCSSRARCSWTSARPSATSSMPRVASSRTASRSFVPAHPIAGKEVARHRPRRRVALPRPPGDPDAAAEDLGRADPEGDRHLGLDRLARAAHDAREPRRRLRRRQPPAAHPRLRLLQLDRSPALPGATSSRSAARAFATSPASRRAIPRSGATS